MQKDYLVLEVYLPIGHNVPVLSAVFLHNATDNGHVTVDVTDGDRLVI